MNAAHNAKRLANEANVIAQPERISLGGWGFYFLVKIILYWRELTDLHPVENLAFAAFLLIPLRSRITQRMRTIVALPAAAMLLYHDSWLPPISRVLTQVDSLSNFSVVYLLDLCSRFINWPLIAALLIGWSIYRTVARLMRVGLVVMLMLLVIACGAVPRPEADQASVKLASATSGTAITNEDPGQFMRDFFAAEAQRNVSFPAAASSTPFDIIFIHICSLSWDDLRKSGLDKHPLWSSFDFLFRQFNSAASYSGPAVVRINRAPCGQLPHQSLYEQASEQCYLLPNLKRSGFATRLALNHDGHFDDFLPLIRKQGIDAAVTPLDGLAPSLRAFDDSPVYDDSSVLNHWLDSRQKSAEQRVALFYNTISLHDGNRILNGAGAKLSIRENYRPRAEKLFDDLFAFMDRLQKSGRKAVVVVVPEHGAALKGDKYQIAGLREIPTPAITSVPVGIRIIGAPLERKTGGVQIDEPSSYLALSQLIANLIKESPFGSPDIKPEDYALNLPTTDFVSENENAAVVRMNSRYWLKRGDEAWKAYLPEP